MANKKEMLKAAAAASEKKKSAAALAMEREATNKETEKKTKKNAEKKESGELKGISFRLPVETIEKLKDLTKVTGLTATGWITSAIETAYELRAADVATMKKLQAK